MDKNRRGRAHGTGTVQIQRSSKKTCPNFSPLFTCLRNKIGCLKLTKQVLICICAVLVQGSLEEDYFLKWGPVLLLVKLVSVTDSRHQSLLNIILPFWGAGNKKLCGLLLKLFMLDRKVGFK